MLHFKQANHLCTCNSQTRRRQEHHVCV